MTVPSWIASSVVSTTPDWANVDTIPDPMASAVFPPALSTIGCRVATNAGAIIAAAIAAVGAAPAAAVVVVINDTYAVDIETVVAPLLAVVVAGSTSRYEV
jgi:hypothetical protein